MSVDLPAPFSPSRACTSPWRRSKSTRSFATSAPKRLVTPSSSRARVAVAFRGLLHGVGDVAQLARGDLLLERGDLGLVLGPHAVRLAEADAAGLRVEHRVRARLEAAVLGLLGGLEDRLVDLLERRRHHLRAEVGLIGVHADALRALLLHGVQRTEPALARDREDDLRALAELVERELLALVLGDEVLRVRVERRGLRIRVGDALLEPRDVVVDGRDLLAADGRGDLLAALVLEVQPGHVADEIAGLVLLEEQAADVLRLALHGRLRVV